MSQMRERKKKMREENRKYRQARMVPGGHQTLKTSLQSFTSWTSDISNKHVLYFTQIMPWRGCVNIKFGMMVAFFLHWGGGGEVFTNMTWLQRNPFQDAVLKMWCEFHQLRPEGHCCCINSKAIVPFWFSIEYHWTALMPFWLSADDLQI